MNPREIRTDVVERGDSKARLDLESRVLSAALKQSFERGDVEGVSLAHRQLFLLLKSGHKPDLGNGDAKKRLSSENITIPTLDSETGEPLDGQAAEDAAEADESAKEAEESKDGQQEESESELAAPEAKEEGEEPQVDEAPGVETNEPPAAEYDASTVETLPPTQVQPPAAPVQALSRRRTEEFIEPPPNPWLQIGPDEGFASQVTTPLAVYELLDVAQVSSFEEIHRNFLRKVRALLVMEAKITDRKERHKALRKLQFLWIAHDILTDPVTRTDCDLRAIGLRGILDEIIPQAPEDASQGGPSNRTPLRIGELLLCAGLLEPTELEIAADMHKAMPEMMFGAFLVKQGFIEEDDLNTVLLGQKLLRSGVITVVQFQTAMEMKRKEGKELSESLVVLGYVSQREIYAATASTQFGVNPGPPPERIEIVGQTSDGKEEVTSLELGNAIPSWKDQLDWSEPERVHLPSVEPPTPPPAPPQKSMGSVLIDGVTDFAESEPSAAGGGKSSLRSLIAGIQAELTALDIATLTEDEAQKKPADEAAALETASSSKSSASLEPEPDSVKTESRPTKEELRITVDTSQTDPPASSASEQQASEAASPETQPAAEVDPRVSLSQKITDPDLPIAEPPPTRSSMKTSERLKLNIDFELESEKLSKAKEARAAAGLDAFEASGSHQIAVGSVKETDSSTDIPAIKSDTTTGPGEDKQSEDTNADEKQAQEVQPTTEESSHDETFDAHPPKGDATASDASPSTHSRATQESTGKIHIDRPHVRTDDSEWQVFPKKDDEKPETQQEDAVDNFEPPHDEADAAIADDTTQDEKSPPTTTTTFPDPTLDAPPPHATLEETAADDESSAEEDSDSDSKHSISDSDAGKSGKHHKRKS